MAAVLAQRQRSNTSTSTSSSHATKSRASTASIHSSASTQPAQRHQYASDFGHAYAQPTQHPYSQQMQSVPYTPEEMITHNQRQLSNPHEMYGIDPSLQHQANLRRSMSVGAGHGNNMAAVAPPMGHRPSFDGTDQGQFRAFTDEPGPDDTGTEHGKNRTKKGSATSAANDAELKRLFAEHRGRPLKEVAAEVIVHERGPKSEKTKQIFAMLW